MESKTHVCVVLTKKVVANISTILEKLTDEWFDVGSTSRTWSLVLLNRDTNTVETVQTIVSKIPQCGKRVFELKNFNEMWNDKKIYQEVFMILPRKIIEQNMYIVIDEHNMNRVLSPSTRTIRYIYGLWEDVSNMPAFMRQLKEDTEKKCSTMRVELLQRNDIMELVDEDVWNMINEKIDRKVVLADISRYYLMWKEGGFYLDMDVRVNQNLYDIVKTSIQNNEKMILFTEHDACNPSYMGKRENKLHTRRIYNCMFWSKEGQSFWKKCIDLTVERCRQVLAENVDITDDDVIWMSGPDVITTIYNEQYSSDKSIRVYNGQDSRTILTHMNGGTWRNKKDQKKLK